MRVQCPSCQITLQLPRPPAGRGFSVPPAAPQFGVRVPAPQPVHVPVTVQPQPAAGTAVRPVVLPPTPTVRRPAADTAVASGSTFHSPTPRAICPDATVPVTVTEIPEAIVEEPGETAEAPFRKKKKKKKFRRSSGGGSGFWTSPGAKLIIAGMFLALVVGAGYFFGIGKLGFLRGRTLVQFNDEIVTIVNRLESSGERFQANAGGNPMQALQSLGPLRNDISNALAEVRKISPPTKARPSMMLSFAFSSDSRGS